MGQSYAEIKERLLADVGTLLLTLRSAASVECGLLFRPVHLSSDVCHGYCYYMCLSHGHSYAEILIGDSVDNIRVIP